MTHNDDITRPLAIDLFCGLGGWTEGLLAEGYDVIGFDIERHSYGEAKYPAQMVLQDVLTIHGKQFKNADLIVSSPPCQEFSYMAMPWSKAKAKERDLLEGRDDPKRLTALFDACFRIQREACEAAGRYIPLVVENVRGAQKWVGRSRWNFGSFHLWGDVPALMPSTVRIESVKAPGRNWSDQSNPNNRRSFTENGGQKVPGFRFDGSGKSFQSASVAGLKTPGRSLDRNAAKKFGTHNMGSAEKIYNELGMIAGVKQPGISGTRANGKGDKWFQDGAAKHGSKSSARKAASAMIAKIPFALSSHIARTFRP